MNGEELTALLSEPPAWMAREGPGADLAVSTRVRFARNLAGHRFPGLAGAGECGAVDRAIRVAALAAAPALRAVALPDLSERARGILVEQFLISPQMAACGTGSLLLFDTDVSAMVNEEDHLRLQCILPGLDLQSAYARLDAADDALEARLDFAFSERWGYLTASPSNVGTGMRASAMLHLPGLAIGGKLARVFEGLRGLGVTARGIYGEGTDAAGAIFQISNEVTLGVSERDLLAKVEGVVRTLAERERSAREELLRTAYDAVVDRIWRAYGTLKTARSSTYGEAAELLSLVRWGSRERILPGIASTTLNSLLSRIGSAGLARAGDEASANRLRATLLRETFAAYPW
ncbi:ATP--guanido phosphotransferase [bacterium]|nr:MAG: ATP--guanido phosphotransferase [bacterium]